MKAEAPYKPPSEPREPGKIIIIDPSRCDYTHLSFKGIVDFDNKSVTLRWNKPTDTGGRPITHFIIQVSNFFWRENLSQRFSLFQKKDKFGGWFDALITDDDNCAATIEELEARVPGLSEGKW